MAEKDFFCLRIEDVSERVLQPILPSKEESHTIILVTEGSYKTKIGFKEYTISSNQIVIYQAGTVFSTEEINKTIQFIVKISQRYFFSVYLCNLPYEFN